MKKTFALLAAVSILAACNQQPNTDKAGTTDTKTVDSTATSGTAFVSDSSSQLSFIGSKPTGTHTGVFTLKEGTLLVNENQLTGGKFLVDINSLIITDIKDDPKSKADLEGHLKSADFFDVAKSPLANFEITSVEPFTDSSSKLKDATNLIKGNLTLKDSTKNISFPARVVINGNKVTASADFNIDRTLWGINYKGPNNPQDWVISKTVNIKLAIAATKK